jgi:hypothetical protein
MPILIIPLRPFFGIPQLPFCAALGFPCSITRTSLVTNQTAPNIPPAFNRLIIQESVRSGEIRCLIASCTLRKSRTAQVTPYKTCKTEIKSREVIMRETGSIEDSLSQTGMVGISFSSFPYGAQCISRQLRLGVSIRHIAQPAYYIVAS